ncbi:MAG: hypothetical protein DRO99_03045, partial [Candidatus Aenigmatarchaeota archaeon]
MNNKLLSVIVFVSFSLTLSAGALAASEQLYHDDGTNDRVSAPMIGFDETYRNRCVKFSVTEPTNILSVQTYWFDNYADDSRDNWYKIKIYDDSMSELLIYPSDQSMHPPTTGWHSVDLSSQGLNVNGDFYVCVRGGREYSSSKDNTMIVGSDTSSPYVASYYTSYPPNSTNLVYDDNDNYMIRVTVSSNDSIEDRLDALEIDVATLQSAVSDLQDNVNSLYGNVTDLQNAVAGLQSQIDCINANITEIYAAIAAGDQVLQDQIDDLYASVNALRQQLNDMNHGTINMFYNRDEATLSVWGEAPEGASNAFLIMRDVQTGDAVLTRSVSVGNYLGNGNSYTFIGGDAIDVSGLEPKSYNIIVMFIVVVPSTQFSIHMVGDVFTNLELEDMQNNITILAANITDIYGNLTEVWIAVNKNTEEIMALWDDSAQQWSAIADLEAANNQQWFAIRMLFRSNRALWRNVANLWMDSNDQWQEIWNLQNYTQANRAKIDKLLALINKMNHGTINMMYNANSQTLNVWGEAPLKSNGAFVLVTKVSDGSPVYFDYSPIYNGGDNKNRYAFHFLKGSGIDVSGWDKESYNVLVFFRGVSYRYAVSDIFTNLELEGVQDSISILFANVTDIYKNLTEVWIAVNDNTNEIVALWDDSAQQWVAIRMLFRSNFMLWNQVGMLWQDSDDQWHAIHDLEGRVDVLEERMNDLKDKLCSMYYSIRDIVISSRVETYYNPNVRVPITYTVTLDETIQNARIIVRSTVRSNVTFSERVRTQTLFANRTYTFSDMVHFSELGYYDLVVKIKGGDKKWVSSNFNVEVVNLPDEVPESSAYITEPAANWDNETDSFYPGEFENPFPHVPEIYWISWNLNDYFDVRVTLLEGTPV